jgi:glycogen synthase
MREATVATTVSPTYAEEVAGHGAVRDHSHKFMGIINGIDYGIWNPLEVRSMHMAAVAFPPGCGSTIRQWTWVQ